MTVLLKNLSSIIILKKCSVAQNFYIEQFVTKKLELNNWKNLPDPVSIQNDICYGEGGAGVVGW